MVRNWGEQFGYQFRMIKTETYLHRHNISIRETNAPSGAALIVATHPTVDETHIFRAINPNIAHLVHADALSHTGYTPLDEKWAVYLSGLIPVYKDDPLLRKQMYERCRNHFQKGMPIAINPTGKTEGTNQFPAASEINLGGILGIWRETNYTIPVVPAFIHVSSITPQAKIANGSSVFVAFGNPLDLKRPPNPQLSGPEYVAMQQKIWDSWESLQKGMGK